MTLTLRHRALAAGVAALIAALGVLASCDPGDDGSGQWRKFSHSTVTR